MSALWRMRGDSGVLLGLLLVMLVFGALIGPQFFAAANLELMARQTVIVCVAALGMTMVIVSGGIDLSVGSIIALSTVVAALLLRMGLDPGLAALGAVGAAALCGTVNGLLITRLRVVPFIVTLGTMLLVRGAAKGLADERRIEAPITWLNGLLRTARDGTGFGVPAGVWLTVFLALVIAAVLGYTRFGRHLFAIGSNERTARLCGVRIDRRKVQVYTLSAALAGLAGRAGVLAPGRRRPDGGDRPGARRHRRRHHRRRQPGRRQGHHRRHRVRRDDHGRDPDRIVAARAAQLGPADRHRVIIVIAVALDRWRQGR
jgi:ribose/xylose/arabinose/galactoside ABC-type transport system permease subunit